MDTRKDKIGAVQHVAVDPLQYQLMAHPLFWMGSADQLKRSALVLAEVFVNDTRDIRAYVDEYQRLGASEIDIHKPSTLAQFVLLAAYAMENLFKAYVIFREPTLIDGGKLNGILRSHDLLALAARAEVTLTQEEARFCDLASSASVSWGRYPITESSSRVVGHSKVTTAAIRTFESLFDRVRAEFGSRFHARTP
ncbi:MAG: hypothetical protein KDJ14_03625 [Xanthomonadales bacterium]|nr:hypothetical protein [Xanthomonadales bacterium]